MKVGDVIRKIIGGASYRIFHILDDRHGRRYKALRIGSNDWRDIPVIDEDKWEVVDPPEGETKYTVGQVVVKKQGLHVPALIIETEVGVEPGFNRYVLLHFDFEGEYQHKVNVYEKDFSKEYVIEKDLNWVTQYGSPTLIVKNFIQRNIEALEKEFEQWQQRLERIHHL